MIKEAELIKRIKDKYEELSQDKIHLVNLEILNTQKERFKQVFPMEKLKSMTLEDYDFPKTIDPIKYENSLLYFIERIPLAIPVGAQRNKQFFYDKTISDLENIRYNTTKTLKSQYPDLSVEEIFNIYRDSLYNYVFSFDVQNYQKADNILSTSNAVKTQLIIYYYPNTLFRITDDSIFKLFSQILNLTLDEHWDTIEKNLYIKNELFKKYDELKDYDLETLSYAIYLVSSDIKVSNFKPVACEQISNQQLYSNIFQNDDLIDDIKIVLKEKKNIILTGTPGVGKTFFANDIIKLLELDKNPVIDQKSLDARCAFVQFHQSYGYEEFVEGMTLKNNTLTVKRGIFKYIVDNALKDIDNNYYIVIDEINRGNISKIFGELLMCIEYDKRNPKYSVSLQYADIENGETFYIPRNVYIIGTMNTADKSLVSIDYALRRRFSFFNLKPAFENPKFQKYLNKCQIKDQILDTIISINHKLEHMLGSADFNIGHSYFIKDNISDMDEMAFKRILKYDILPLLKEYLTDLSEYDKNVLEIFRSDNKNLHVLNSLLDEINNGY